jgi:hypothetical protein
MTADEPTGPTRKEPEGTDSTTTRRRFLGAAAIASALPTAAASSATAAGGDSDPTPFDRATVPTNSVGIYTEGWQPEGADVRIDSYPGDADTEPVVELQTGFPLSDAHGAEITVNQTLDLAAARSLGQALLEAAADADRRTE